MRRIHVALAFSAAATVFCAPQAAADMTAYNIVHSGSMPVVPSYDDANFVTTMLNAHNMERRMVGVPDLKWSPTLAAEAYEWAKVIARKGYLEHDAQRAHGENLWLNTSDHRSPASMIGGWSIEKTLYIPGAGHPYESRTGNWHDVGHYTQMVWSSTTKVGCAIARGAEKDFLVCRYDPIGNWQGMAAYDPRNAPPVSVALNAAPAPAPKAANAPQAVQPMMAEIPVPQPKPTMRASAD